MYARVCTTWRDAAKEALVPSHFKVQSVRSMNAMRVISTALPNLQQLSIYDVGDGNKYADGEDADGEWAAYTATYSTHDLNIISNFKKLRVLELIHLRTTLNGRYPVLFNFPLLQNLVISFCANLKWDFDMLSGCPLLRELWLNQLPGLTGDLKSLRVLQNTLETVSVSYCLQIQGNFMVLADFPRLKVLSIYSNNKECPVTGDIRDIQQDDFPSLETLRLPSNVIGGRGYVFQRISDVPSFMHAIHPLLTRFPETFDHESRRNTQWTLSEGSDDWYGATDTIYEPPFGVPPFDIDCVLAEGLRCGWRWSSVNPLRKTSACEVNWLDPEPSEDSDGYEKYVECMQRIEDETDLFRGYYEPPTEEEYRRLCLRDRGD